MEYRELLPDASLRHVVRRYWFLTGDDVSGEPGEPALPDGWCAASTPDRRVARAVLAIRAATVVVQDAIARDVGTTPLGRWPLARTRHRDTLRVRTPATVGVELTSGLVRFVSADSVVFDLRAGYTDGTVASSRGTGGQDTTRATTPFQVVHRLTGGALRASTSGHHVVLNGDGTGISRVP